MYYSLLEVSESGYVVQIREKNGRKIALGNDFMLAPTAAPSCRCRTKIQLSPGKVNKYRVGESFEQLLKVTMKPQHSPPKPTHYFLYSSYQASTNIYLAFINTVIIKLLLINCFVNKACRVFDKRKGAFNACYNVVKSTAPPFPWHLKRSKAVAWPLIGPGPGCCSLIGQWAAQG